MLRHVFVLSLSLVLLGAQPASREKLPGGKSRALELAKHDYEKSKEDAAEMLKLVKEIQEEIEENREFVVDIKTIRKTERIEKLARNIRNRMKRVQ